jgi:prepilin-type N-terminal cleavage/methylation domain-containing protein
MLKKNGFTLIELIVVIAIIAILIAIAIPVISGLLERSKIAVARQQSQQVRSACASWIEDGFIAERYTLWSTISTAGVPNHSTLLSNSNYLSEYIDPASLFEMMNSTNASRIQSKTMSELGSTLTVTWPSSTSELIFNYSE